MFSKELQLMDRNTTRLMIDELSAQVEEFRTAYKEKEEECKEKDDIIASLKKQLQNLKASDK